MSVEAKPRNPVELKPSVSVRTDSQVNMTPGEIRDLFNLGDAKTPVSPLKELFGLAVASSITKDIAEANDRPKSLTCSPQLSC